MQVKVYDTKTGKERYDIINTSIIKSLPYGCCDGVYGLVCAPGVVIIG